MRYYFKRTMTLLLTALIIASVLPLSACSKEGELVDGSLLQPATECLGEESEDLAVEVLRSVLKDYYRESGESVTEKEISDEAGKIARMTLSGNIGKTDHRLFMEAVRRNADSLAPLFAGKHMPLTELGDAYIELTENVSSDYVGKLIYDLILHGYDKRIERHLAASDAVNNVLADKVAGEKAIFEGEIGEKNFSELIKVSLVFRALLAGDGGSDLFDRFTDAELLILLKEVRLEGIKVSAEGYELLFKYYSDSLVGKETTYLDELIYAMTYNDDVSLILEGADELLALISSVMDSMDKVDVAILKNGDVNRFVTLAFSRFDDEDWALFEMVKITR